MVEWNSRMVPYYGPGVVDPAASFSAAHLAIEYEARLRVQYKCKHPIRNLMHVTCMLLCSTYMHVDPNMPVT